MALKMAKSRVERTRKKTQTKRERNSQKRLEKVIFRRETSKERTMWRLSRRLSIPSVSFVQPRLLPNFIDVNVNKNGEKGEKRTAIVFFSRLITISSHLTGFQQFIWKSGVKEGEDQKGPF